jgi:hypothetical protein
MKRTGKADEHRASLLLLGSGLDGSDGSGGSSGSLLGRRRLGSRLGSRLGLRLGGRLRSGRRGRSGVSSAEAPVEVDDADVGRGKVLEERLGEVEAAVRAGRALVLDDGVGGLEPEGEEEGSASRPKKKKKKKRGKEERRKEGRHEKASKRTFPL